jgi:hypothetical protein
MISNKKKQMLMMIGGSNLEWFSTEDEVSNELKNFGDNQDASERTWRSDNESEARANLRSARNKKWAEWFSEKKLWKLDLYL